MSKPENINGSVIGARLLLDPHDALRAILRAHQRNNGAAVAAARDLEITYQTMRRMIRTLSAEVWCPRHGRQHRIQVRGPDRKLRTLDEALRAARARAALPPPGEPPLPAPHHVRKRVRAALARGARLVDLSVAAAARGTPMSVSLISKFASGQRATVSRASLLALDALVPPLPDGQHGRRTGE